MITEERVGAALRGLAADARPGPDPYGRVVRRFRRRRQRRTVAMSVVAVVAVTGIAAAMPGGPGPTTPDDPAAALDAWAERLRTSPTRGSLAGDATFVAAVRERAAERQRAGDYPVGDEVSEVDVLFAGDVGESRVVLVAFHLAKADPETSWPNDSGWFVAPRGASPAAVTDPAAAVTIGDGLEPFETLETTEGPVEERRPLSVGLAPAGCAVESAPLPAADTWTPEATGSYLTRVGAEVRPEWWRVVCDGTVRQSGPAPGGYADPPDPPSAAEALRRARGADGGDAALSALRDEAWGWEVNGDPFVVWHGAIDDTGPKYDGQAGVFAAPAVGGYWQVRLTVTYATPHDGAFSTEVGSASSTDPAETAVFGIDLHDAGAVMVVTPPEATRVEARVGGTVVGSAPVSDAAAIVHTRVVRGLTLVARDATGAVLATGRVLSVDADASPSVSAWN